MPGGDGTGPAGQGPGQAEAAKIKKGAGAGEKLHEAPEGCASALCAGLKRLTNQESRAPWLNVDTAEAQ